MDLVDVGQIWVEGAVRVSLMMVVDDGWGIRQWWCPVVVELGFQRGDGWVWGFQ